MVANQKSAVCRSCGVSMEPRVHINVFGWVTGRTCTHCGSAFYRNVEDRRKENLYRYYWSLIVCPR